LVLSREQLVFVGSDSTWVFGHRQLGSWDEQDERDALVNRPKKERTESYAGRRSSAAGPTQAPDENVLIRSLVLQSLARSGG